MPIQYLRHNAYTCTCNVIIRGKSRPASIEVYFTRYQWRFYVHRYVRVRCANLFAWVFVDRWNVSEKDNAFIADEWKKKKNSILTGLGLTSRCRWVRLSMNWDSPGSNSVPLKLCTEMMRLMFFWSEIILNSHRCGLKKRKAKHYSIVFQRNFRGNFISMTCDNYTKFCCAPNFIEKKKNI